VPPLATDWDQYYDSPVPTARLTRRYTGHWLRTMMHRYAAGRQQLGIIEFGGGNSCFFKGLTDALPIARYEIVDLNAKSLALFEEQARGVSSVRAAAHRADLLKEVPALEPADIVYSVGLIEHFSPEGTREVLRRHFSCVRPGGIVIVTAPTPTWLYRATRGAAELIGVWQFPDERPLAPAEIINAGEGLGLLRHSATLWPQVLTQHAVVWQALPKVASIV
jgi:SAM-dependent methyltransferase